MSHVDLGVTNASGLTVDPNTGNVYIPIDGANEVLVRDSSGSTIATVSVTEPVSVAVDPVSGQVWVAESNNTITSFDPMTFALGASYAIDPSTAGCPRKLDPVGGYVWFTFGCNSGEGGIAVLNPSDDSVVPTGLGVAPLLAQPPASTTLYAAAGTTVYKVDIANPATGASIVSSRTVGCINVASMAWSEANDELVLGCTATSGAIRLAPDLSTVSSYATSESAPAVTANAAGGYVALEADVLVWSQPDLYVYAAGGTTPLELIPTFDSTVRYIEDDRIATNADGSRLYLLHQNDSNSEVLTVVTNPSTPAGWISVPTQPTGRAGDVSFTGKLTMSDGASAGSVSLTVTRTNPDSSQTVLPDVTTTSTGAFTVTDRTALAGSTTYTIGYPGDTTHGATSQSVPIDVVRQAPTLTLAVSHTVITAGGSTTLTATLSGHGTNADVSLYAGSTLLATKAVNSARQAIWTVKPHVDTTYHVHYSGDEMYTSRTSTSHTVTVKYAVHESLVGSYGMNSGYHLYHYHSSCGSAAHTGCPRMNVVIVPRPAAEITLQFEEYLSGAWRLVLDRGVKTATNGTCSLTITYNSTKVENIPMRMSVSYVPASKTNASNRGAWMNFKVTR